MPKAGNNRAKKVKRRSMSLSEMKQRAKATTNPFCEHEDCQLERCPLYQELCKGGTQSEARVETQTKGGNDERDEGVYTEQ